MWCMFYHTGIIEQFQFSKATHHDKTGYERIQEQSDSGNGHLQNNDHSKDTSPSTLNPSSFFANQQARHEHSTAEQQHTNET